MRMSSGGPNPGDTPTYIFLVVLIFIVVRRARMVFVGSKVSRARAIGFSIYYTAFASALTLTSFFNGVPVYFAALYLAVGVVAFYGSFLISESRIGFWKGSDGSIYSKGAIIIYLIYLVGLVARVGISLFFVGPSAFSFTASSTAPPSPSAQDAEVVADLLLAVGAGSLVGRNARVLKRFSLITQGKEKVGDTPPTISYF